MRGWHEGAEAPGMGVPFLDELRSARALSALLGVPVRPVRIRVKPGRSAIVAWQREGADHLGGWGWTAVLRDPDKLANLRRRAERHGETLLHHAGDDSGFVLVSGGVRADPKLAKPIARAAEVIDLEACTVIGYNPGRRVLLRHPGVLDRVGGEAARDGESAAGAGDSRGSTTGDAAFVRIAASGDRQLLAAAQRWQTWGLPTLPVGRLGARPTAVTSPWWGTGTLESAPDPGIAEAVGASIAELHRHAPGPDNAGRDAPGPDDADRDGPPGHAHRLPRVLSPQPVLEATVRALTRLLDTSETRRVETLCAAVGRRLETVTDAPGTPIHGDLSPDQVLVGGAEFRIIDLDRAGEGPGGIDLGRWVAACRLRDNRGRVLEDAFLRGYARSGGRFGESAEVATWTAWALLLTAMEPWRTCRADWREEMTRHLDLAENALTGSRRSSTVPPTVVVDGVELSLRRAWPEKSGRIAFEARAGGTLRAGFLTPRSGAPESGAEATRPDAQLRTAIAESPHATLLPPDTDPDLPGLARLLAGQGGRLVSHRPGRRAVIALPDGRFAKCVRAGKAAGIIAGQERAAAFAPAFTLPQVLEADEATVVFSRVPGVELHDPAALGEHWERAWVDCLDAWARAGEGTSAWTAQHTAVDEARVLAEWRDRAEDHLGDIRARLDPLIAEVTRALRATPVPDSATASADSIPVPDSATTSADGTTAAGATSRPSVATAPEHHPPPNRSLNWGPIHRDLHDKQLMWDEKSGPGLLDVDTACLGERELDLGNLRAHAHWRRGQGLWTPAEADVVLRAIAATTSASGCDPERVRLYERASLLRLVCVYAFRPQWSGRTGGLIDAAG